MLRKCIGEGFRAAMRNPGITTLLWVWSLVLAVIAAFPAWFWLGQAFNLRPESDRLLTGFSMSVFTELGQYDRSPVSRVILAALVSVLVLAALANPFVSGGLLSSLRDGGREPQGTRTFSNGGARYYWRFFRLLVYGAVTAIPLMAGAGAAFSPLIRWFDDQPWEPGSLLGRLFPLAAVLLIGAWIILALDLARARTVLEEARGPLRHWLWALLCVWRHPIATFGLLAVMAGLYTAIAAIFTGATGALPTSGWPAILAAVLLQQIVMFLRSALRVGLVGGELALCSGWLPPPAAIPASSHDSFRPEPELVELGAGGAATPEAPPAEAQVQPPDQTPPAADQDA